MKMYSVWLWIGDNRKGPKGFEHMRGWLCMVPETLSDLALLAQIAWEAEGFIVRIEKGVIERPLWKSPKSSQISLS